MTTVVQSFIQAWQSQGLLSSNKISLEQTMKEPPNALVLAINMQNLPLKDTADWIQNATEDEIKEHKGLRTSFFISEILYAGFTFVAPPPGSDKGVRGDRLAIFDSEEDKRTVIFYTYKGEQNKKLDTYVKTKRFEECTSISQGMVVSGTIWANKLRGMIEKKGTHSCENMGIFDLCLVHLGIRSIMSKASESGMVLEIKSIAPLHQYTPALCNLVSHDLPPRSIQQSVEFRNQFLDGIFVSEEKRKHLKQVQHCAYIIDTSFFMFSYHTYSIIITS